MRRRAGGAQHVPRPGHWAPGGAPTWAGRDLSVLEDLDAVGRALSVLPAAAPPSKSGGARESAVLVPLVDLDGRAAVVLTRRADHLRNHSGEVSFPGGRIEPGETPWLAALREAREEIALDPADVVRVAELDPVSTRVSNSLILPVVGRVTGSRDAVAGLVADPGEVARILVVPLSDLVRDDTYHSEEWTTPAGRIDVHFFHLDDETVWGATGRLLHRLVDVVTSVGHGPA